MFSPVGPGLPEIVESCPGSRLYLSPQHNPTVTSPEAKSQPVIVVFSVKNKWTFAINLGLSGCGADDEAVRKLLFWY